LVGVCDDVGVSHPGFEVHTVKTLRVIGKVLFIVAFLAVAIYFRYVSGWTG